MVESKQSPETNKGLLFNQYESILLGEVSQVDHVGRVIILIEAAPLTKNLPLILIPLRINMELELENQPLGKEIPILNETIIFR